MASVASYLHQNLSQSCHSIKIIYICLFFSNFSRENAAVHLKVRHKTELFPDQTGPDLVGVTAAALVLAGAAIADWLKKWRRQRRSGDFQPIRDKPLRWGVTNRVVSATFQGDNYRYCFFFSCTVHSGPGLSLTVIVSLMGDSKTCQIAGIMTDFFRIVCNLKNRKTSDQGISHFSGRQLPLPFFSFHAQCTLGFSAVINNTCLINRGLKK